MEGFEEIVWRFSGKVTKFWRGFSLTGELCFAKIVSLKYFSQKKKYLVESFKITSDHNAVTFCLLAEDDDIRNNRFIMSLAA